MDLSGRAAGARPPSVEVVLQQIRSRATPAPVAKPWRNATLRWMGSAVAAVAVVLLAPPAVRELRRVLTPQPVSAAIQEYRTTAGQRARLTLPDSSTVVLAPQSVIRYAANFGSRSSRTVALEGQALFTVTHSVGAPFVVNTGGIATRVLGTSFAVRRYATDAALKVIVAQGRVAVGATVLGTGDIATAGSATQISVSRENAVTSQLAWAEGRLTFSGVPLRDVIPELQRWYGITIAVADRALLDRAVHTTFATESAATAIDLVAIAVGARAEFRGRHAVLHSH